MKPVFSFIGVCKCLALLVLVTTLTGCGTIVNHLPVQQRDQMEADGRPYGGVRWDLSSWNRGGDPAVILTLDVPCSLVGDTLTLPYDLAHKP